MEMRNASMDSLTAVAFLDQYLSGFKESLENTPINNISVLLPNQCDFSKKEFKEELIKSLLLLKEKRERHPKLFGVNSNKELLNPESLLDALYEKGIIPTYSFPKNVVSMYISDYYGKVSYQVERGLDITIGEYAPGRAIVVDKQLIRLAIYIILEVSVEMHFHQQRHL